MATTPPPSGEDATAPRGSGSGGGLFDSDLAGSVKQSAQQIWLAGLGAFAKAQEEGSKMFEALVREGASMQRRTQAPPADAAAERPADVGSRMADAVGGLAGQATQQWDRLESIFEDRVAKALKRLGVPSVRDVAALEARIDRLTAEVARLSGAAAAPQESTGDAGPEDPGAASR